MCGNLLQILIKSEKSPHRKRALRTFQLEHRVFQQQERTCYRNRKVRAASDPDNFTSITTDGVTQATCCTPRKFKYEYAEEKLRQRFTGVLAHGKDT